VYSSDQSKLSTTGFLPLKLLAALNPALKACQAVSIDK
jgi:hypothetical protein